MASPLSNQYRLHITIDAKPAPFSVTLGPIPGSVMTPDQVTALAERICGDPKVLEVDVSQRYNTSEEVPACLS